MLHKISMDSTKVNMQLVADVTGGELNTLKIVYEGGSELTRHKEKEVKGINFKRRNTAQSTSSHSSLSQVGILTVDVTRRGALLNFVRARVFAC